MAVGRVVMLSGGSSAGKTTLGRKLQESLDGTWLLLGVDVLLWTMPVALFHNPDGVDAKGGVITRGGEFLRLFEGFRTSVASIARSGIDVLIDEVMQEGSLDQQMWNESLGDLDVLWVGVKCAPDVAAAREKARGDRAPGVARHHAMTVHEGVRYDLEVDTGEHNIGQLVTEIASAVKQRWSIDSTEPTDKEAWPVRSGWSASPPWESGPG